MLRREPLEYFPSMNPRSIILYHKWKTQKKGTRPSCGNNLPVLDMYDKPNACVGTWISPENMEQYQSAVSTLHKARNIIGANQKPYTDCITLDRQGAFSWLMIP
jgi:hypothetical protein